MLNDIISFALSAYLAVLMLVVTSKVYDFLAQKLSKKFKQVWCKGHNWYNHTHICIRCGKIKKVVIK
jgi:hypothetical protein